MNKKNLNVILGSIRNAKEVIGELACVNYPYTPFADKDFYDMYYQLNDMCLAIYEKIHELEAKTNDEEES